MNARISRLRRCAGLLLLLATLAPSFWPAVSSAQDAPSRRKILRRTGFLGPQLSITPNGTSYLLWAKAYGNGFDLFLSIRDPGGHLGAARRVNEREGSVDYRALDELRPALATGPDGQAAVGWVDDQANIHAAIYDPDRSSWQRWQLNAETGNPVRGFVHLDFDERGRLYIVWLDARDAALGEEEPAQLYGVFLKDHRAKAREKCLSQGWSEHLCGCCRPFVRIDNGRLEVLVRNVTEDGYRDIFRGAGSIDGELESFERVGPPTWKLEACPMSGAVSNGQFIWWRDGSTGHPRVVEASAGATLLREVIGEETGWSMTASPRLVGGAGEPTLFVPGRPRGRLLRRSGGQWRVLSDAVPEWCNSVISVSGELLMVGDEYSELKLELLQLRP